MNRTEGGILLVCLALVAGCAVPDNRDGDPRWGRRVGYVAGVSLWAADDALRGVTCYATSPSSVVSCVKVKP